MEDLINNCNRQIKRLSIIAESQPQAFYQEFVSRFKSNLNYSMRTISEINNLLFLSKETPMRGISTTKRGDNIQ